MTCLRVVHDHDLCTFRLHVPFPTPHTPHTHARMEPGGSSTGSQAGGRPPNVEMFLLKDLDTGLRSYVTDQEWVEKPTLLSGELTKTTVVPTGAAKPPLPDARWGERAGERVKRARSDELQTMSRTLRSSDHVRVVAHKKRDRDFMNLYRWQKVKAHHGPVRVLEFSRTGRYLATGGQDMLIKIWDIDVRLEDNRLNIMKGIGGEKQMSNGNLRVPAAYSYIRKGLPLVICRGHTADVVAVSWSKNDFLLSASVDRTIRLWHPKAKACIRKLLHSDIVTSVAFHPSDEQICISGSADGMVRMWHLKERKLLSKAETDDLITACAITPDGTTALVGTYYGRCKFYGLFDEILGEWQFKHTTQLDVRSTRARNAQGKKICGFRFFSKTDKVLISSNDSRLRLYRLDDKSVLSKFLGHQNTEAHLNASFSPGGKFVLCGSETRMVHIWELDHTLHLLPTSKHAPHTPRVDNPPNPAKDNGIANESFFVQDAGQVTAAVFAPRQVPKEALHLRAAFTNSRTSGLVIVTASDDGDIRVFGCC